MKVFIISKHRILLAVLFGFILVSCQKSPGSEAQTASGEVTSSQEPEIEVVGFGEPLERLVYIPDWMVSLATANTLSDSGLTYDPLTFALSFDGDDLQLTSPPQSFILPVEGIEDAAARRSTETAPVTALDFSRAFLEPALLASNLIYLNSDGAVVVVDTFGSYEHLLYARGGAINAVAAGMVDGEAMIWISGSGGILDAYFADSGASAWSQTFQVPVKILSGASAVAAGLESDENPGTEDNSQVSVQNDQETGEVAEANPALTIVDSRGGLRRIDAQSGNELFYSPEIRGYILSARSATSLVQVTTGDIRLIVPGVDAFRSVVTLPNPFGSSVVSGYLDDAGLLVLAMEDGSLAAIDSTRSVVEWYRSAASDDISGPAGESTASTGGTETISSNRVGGKLMVTPIGKQEFLAQNSGVLQVISIEDAAILMEYPVDAFPVAAGDVTRTGASFRYFAGSLKAFGPGLAFSVASVPSVTVGRGDEQESGAAGSPASADSEWFSSPLPSGPVLPRYIKIIENESQLRKISGFPSDESLEFDRSALPMELTFELQGNTRGRFSVVSDRETLLELVDSAGNILFSSLDKVSLEPELDYNVRQGTYRLRISDAGGDGDSPRFVLNHILTN